MTEAEPFSFRITILAALPGLLLGGCAQMGGSAAEAPALEPGVFALTRQGPEGAPPGTCWGRTVSPAVIETVVDRTEVEPAVTNPDGTLSKLPVYRTEEKQRIVQPRVDNWFLTPCTEVRGPDFVSSLQRALAVRGHYAGEISGEMDGPTRAAVQAYQRQMGFPDSGVLSLDAARSLGLVEAERSATG
jgi:hypothetical protein